MALPWSLLQACKTFSLPSHYVCSRASLCSALRLSMRYHAHVLHSSSMRHNNHFTALLANINAHSALSPHWATLLFICPLSLYAMSNTCTPTLTPASCGCHHTKARILSHSLPVTLMTLVSKLDNRVTRLSSVGSRRWMCPRAAQSTPLARTTCLVQRTRVRGPRWRCPSMSSL